MLEPAEAGLPYCSGLGFGGDAMSGDYETGYEDGLRAGREATEHEESDGAPGKRPGEIAGVVEDIVNENLEFGESGDYQEGFRKGVDRKSVV
jgi:hypothetical protein